MFVVMIQLEFEYLIYRHAKVQQQFRFFLVLGKKVHVNQLINKFG